MSVIPEDEQLRREAGGAGDALQEEKHVVRDGVAARETASNPIRTVLNQTYELREIVVAQGIEYNNPQLPAADRMPRCLQRYFPDLRMEGEDRGEYISRRQRVRFRIRVVNTKTAFRQAVETEGLHVIYAGHARYGRGPCFATSDAAGDNWEQGTDSDTGLFRMGYGAILIPISDIEHHGYRFYPVSGATRIQSGWLHPSVQRSRLRHFPLSDELKAKILPQGQPTEEHYWGYRTRDGQNILLWAGWRQTISAPMDLAATNIQCRCFSLFGCYTFRHWWRILRHRRRWQRTATDRFAYFTTGTADQNAEINWLRSLFSYPRRNDYQSWYPSLQWSRARATRYLRAMGYRYRII